jgi:hypothetical protein
MNKLLLISTLALVAGFAYAQTKPAPDDAPAKTGYEKAENDLFPKAASYDGKWTVKGFSIVNAQGETVFTWKDFGATQRIDMIVSWSPDSQRVVLLINLIVGQSFMPPNY